MKPVKLRKTLAAFAALFTAFTMAASGSVNYTITYDGGLTLGTDTLGGVTYTTVGYSGLHNYGDPGTPFLPVDFISFSVPYNATNFSVVAVQSDNHIINIKRLVYPSQLISTPRTVTPPDNSVYNSGAYFPSPIATVVDEGFLAGENHLVTVAVRPITYFHSGSGSMAINQLKVSGTVSLTLNYELNGTPAMCPIARMDTSLRNEGFELVRSMVVNPNDVRGNAYSQSYNPMHTWTYPPGPLDVEGTPSTFVIVTTPEMKHPLRRLAALRRQKGIPVKLVTVDEVLADTLSGQGDVVNWIGEPYLVYTDDAGKLRQYLRMHYYYYGTQYVLLAGTQVPRRNGLADCYFGDLNADWNSQIEKGMELYVGRLLGTQKSQIDNYTDKLFRYELNPGNGDYSYLERALFTYQTQKMDPMDVLTGFFGDETFMEDSEVDDFPTGNDVLDSINTNHYAFICSFNKAEPSHMTTHGYPYTLRYLWAVDTAKVVPFVTDTETGNGLNCMQNKHYPAVYFSGAGEPMYVGSYNGYNVDVNYAESFTMGKDYGGPVFMGYIHEFEGLEPMFYFGEILDYCNTKTMCEAYSISKRYIHMDRADDIVPWFNFLGDPVLEMWTDTPQTYSGITVTRGDSTISVTGVPIGSKMSYCGNDGSLGLVKATSSTISLSHVDANSSVMLYKHNMIPYFAPLVLQNTSLDNSQYVIASDVLAGRTVDTGRTSGDVTVSSGVDYEIEATGQVKIMGGFKVELGARFSITPSEYNK